MTIKLHDITRPADLKTHSQGTGSVRQHIPEYVDLLPPCNHSCPAGENIQAWLALAAKEQYHEAWQVLVADNPLPAVHGRVCYHPCESDCNRSQIDNPVSIHAIERFLGDMALRENWQIDIPNPPTSKRVLVVGAGPSGLSVAYHLARLGHTVEIREAGPVAGGMMHFGIPAYRLPRDILEQEVARIEAMGVTIKYDCPVTDVIADKITGIFDAVFLAIGAQLGKRIDIPAREAGKILDAVSFLHQVETGDAPQLGKRVAVYGGGNTAMDAARTAKRLGAEEALIIYRRDREHMPAHNFEADEALEEGVKINWLRSISAVDHDKIEVEVMTLDEHGKPQATGETETLSADSLILALGQQTDSRFLRKVHDLTFKADSSLVVDEQMMTTHTGLFAGGDMVPGQHSVTIATGHGKKAARHIDAWLNDSVYTPAPKHPVVGFERLHVWYLSEAERQHQPHKAPETRSYDFSEVVGDLSETEAVFEAQRCFSCGNCFECDGCYGACPEHAVEKLGEGKRYRFDYQRCTGCAVCYEQCPCHAIEMVADKS